MTPLTYAAFDGWLAAYGRASAEDARYYESPFDPPLAGRQAIYDSWAVGAQNLTDKTSAYEILAVRDNLGIARWQPRFVVKATGAAMALDCIFLAEFDQQGLCRLF